MPLKLPLLKEISLLPEEMVAALDDGDEKDALVATLDGLKADDGTLAMAKTEVEGATAEQVAEMNARAAGLHEALTISRWKLMTCFTDGPGNAELQSNSGAYTGNAYSLQRGK